jgi:putative transposase
VGRLRRRLRCDAGQQPSLGEAVRQALTLPYSPYQNAKQEVFWSQVEGRLLAMLEGVAADLRLEFLNEATQTGWLDQYTSRS